MATNSGDSPASSTGNGRNSDGQEQKDVTKESADKPPFAIPQAMREEQIHNAVKFLSHPKVRGYPVNYRRSFLEKKGLTREEIDEAFRRVPDPPSNAKIVGNAVKDQAGQSKPPSVELQNPTAQPAVDRTSRVDIVPTSRQWSHVFLAMGILAASGYGAAVLFRKICISRLKAWIRKVVKEGDESREENANARAASLAGYAANLAASAVTFVANSHQEILAARDEERRFYEDLMEKINVQVNEMKSMNHSLTGHVATSAKGAVQKLNSSNENCNTLDRMGTQPKIGNGLAYSFKRGYEADNSIRDLPSNRKQVQHNSIDSGDVAVCRRGPDREMSKLVKQELTAASHPESFMEILAMVRRGERPPNVQDINDMPPNPNQEISKSLLQPRPKPWEIPQLSGRLSNTDPVHHLQANGEGFSILSQENSCFMPGAADVMHKPKSAMFQKQQSGEEPVLLHSENGEDGQDIIQELAEIHEVPPKVSEEGSR